MGVSLDLANVVVSVQRISEPEIDSLPSSKEFAGTFTLLRCGLTPAI
jgi:hypothetical protein